MIGDRRAISDTTSQPLGGAAVDQVGDDLDESGDQPSGCAGRECFIKAATQTRPRRPRPHPRVPTTPDPCRPR